ncbi:sulfite dehydrogenase [Polynucleobacter campilacus]|jgi:sulfane dehydrogenase subunit SoxC|uniref:Sulfite dehydrogenase n=1 Tax=Polynucleobacter campilacus TaxID=1743163 RepID=A0A254PWB7_9BURK|nr:sulfite dehydrogenase [Polynucleobacter campilacus]OWS70843.1 sulfite dehydrogenase [Polynucleobacter campilacus]
MSKRDKLSNRRLFLKSSLVAGASINGVISANSAFAKNQGDGFLEVDPWTKTQGSTFVNPPYGLPSKYEKNVVRLLPSPAPTFLTGSRTPLQSLHGIITPNGLVFERHHAGVPDINPDLHKLVIHGLVDRPMVFSMEDIVRFPSESRINFLECSGNSAAELKKASNQTVQQIHGLLSCCEWTGVRLSTILQECGVQPSAKWALAEGADGAAMTRSIPMSKMMDDALLVYAQNGEMLRAEQGYPLRLFLPGYEGNMSIKWLRRIKLGTEPWQTREETSAYTDLRADGKALQFTFAMEVKSVITQPSGMMKLKSKGFYEISGFAWSGNGKIRRVEVSTDGGKSWSEAVLQEPVIDKSLVRFRFPWMWDGAPATLMSRAVDSSGEVQPTMDAVIKAKSANTFYHNNAIQPWRVAANGEVTNGR